jgi:hypothetical protein
VVTADDRLIVYGGNGKLALVETAKRSPKGYTELAARDRLFKAHARPHVVLAGGGCTAGIGRGTWCVCSLVSTKTNRNGSGTPRIGFGPA